MLQACFLSAREAETPKVLMPLCHCGFCTVPLCSVPLCLLLFCLCCSLCLDIFPFVVRWPLPICCSPFLSSTCLFVSPSARDWPLPPSIFQCAGLSPPVPLFLHFCVSVCLFPPSCLRLETEICNSPPGCRYTRKYRRNPVTLLSVFTSIKHTKDAQKTNKGR